MSTKEQDFKERLVAMMADLNENRRSDAEIMWLIGSLATRLVDLNKLKTWTQFKAKLTPQAYDRLLMDFQQQGNGYHQQGKEKAAYAIHVLACSTVARTQSDPVVKRGEALLDKLINNRIRDYRKTVAARTATAG